MNIFEDKGNILVYDLGSAMFRAGHAGALYPEISIPSLAVDVGDGSYLVGEENIYKNHNKEIVPLIEESGNISKSDILAAFLAYTHERLGEPSGQGMSAIFTQPAHLVADNQFGFEWRKCIAEVAFKTMNYDSICITSDALLGAYAHCYHTATVVDFGWSCLRVIPIVDGKPLLNCSRYHICGGMVMSQMLADRLKSRDIHIVDNSQGKYTKQQCLSMERRTCADLIKQACYFNTGVNTDDQENIVSINGQLIDVKNDMEFLSGVFWNKLTADQDQDKDSIDILPLNVLIEDSISNAPDEYKKALWSNIVTCGGFSTISGFQAKILDSFKFNKSFDRKVHYPMNEIVAGDFCVWTGGSILASSPVIDRYCVSRQDYDEEYGDQLLRIKCEPQFKE